METFSQISDAIRSIEQKLNKDCTKSRLQDDNTCVVKAISVAGDIDFNSANLLAVKYLNRKFQKGVTTRNIIDGIDNVFNSINKNVIGYWQGNLYKDYGVLKTIGPINHMEKKSQIQLNFYRRKKMTVEQLRRQSKNKTYFVIVTKHALVVKNGTIIDFIESKKRTIKYIFEID